MVPTPKMMSRYITDVREFERIRRLRNGVVHGMEEADPADLHDAANRLHEIVEEIIPQPTRPASMRAGETSETVHAAYTLCMSFEAMQ